MNMKKRIELIHLLSDELTDSASRYERVLEEHGYVYAGSNVEMFDCKEAIQRRIKVLREELMELSKSL